MAAFKSQKRPAELPKKLPYCTVGRRVRASAVGGNDLDLDPALLLTSYELLTSSQSQKHWTLASSPAGWAGVLCDHPGPIYS